MKTTITMTPQKLKEILAEHFRLYEDGSSVEVELNFSVGENREVWEIELTAEEDE